MQLGNRRRVKCTAFLLGVDNNEAKDYLKDNNLWVNYTPKKCCSIRVSELSFNSDMCPDCQKRMEVYYAR